MVVTISAQHGFGCELDERAEYLVLGIVCVTPTSLVRTCFPTPMSLVFLLCGGDILDKEMFSLIPGSP